MTVTDYDLLVIGGGPAGSCAATFARQRGWRVVVVEKESFPRFRIGESLLPMGNDVLRAAGVWAKVEAAGFVEKFGARFCLADGAGEKEIDFACGYVPGLERTFQVERAKFDALLLEHAREQGAEVRLEVAVKAVETRDDHVVATLVPRGGEATTVTARWAIDAGGRDNLYGSEMKRALDPSPFPRRLAIYSHFRGVPRAPGKAGGHTVVVRLTDGWFWLIPIDAQRTSVGLVTTAEALRAAEVEPAELFRRAVAASPKLRELMGEAEATMPFHVTADYSYFRRELAAERVVLTGDAGGFFDPIFSSGVYLAMWSAQRAVATIAEAQAQHRALSPVERKRYTRAVKSHAGVFQRLIEAFYDNASFAVFLRPRPPFDLGRGLNSIVAGHARLTWPLWWRFRMFLLICRLQRYFRIVPPIEYSEHAVG